MLKETPQSLRLYFGFVAAFSFYWGMMSLYRAGISPLVVLLSTASIVFGFLFAYIVIRFAELLPKRPDFIRTVLAANLALSVVGFALSLSVAVQLAAFFDLGLALLIYFYLVKSVTRLSAEATITSA
jgi:hypothetical protein